MGAAFILWLRWLGAYARGFPVIMLFGALDGAFAVFIGGVDVGSFFNEQAGSVGVVASRSDHQCSEAALVGGVDVGTVFDDVLDGVRISIPSSEF